MRPDWSRRNCSHIGFSTKLGTSPRRCARQVSIPPRSCWSCLIRPSEIFSCAVNFDAEVALLADACGSPLREITLGFFTDAAGFCCAGWVVAGAGFAFGMTGATVGPGFGRAAFTAACGLAAGAAGCVAGAGFASANFGGICLGVTGAMVTLPGAAVGFASPPSVITLEFCGAAVVVAAAAGAGAVFM